MLITCKKASIVAKDNYNNNDADDCPNDGKNIGSQSTAAEHSGTSNISSNLAIYCL